MSYDSIVLRGNTQFANEVSVVGDFDVNSLLSVTASTGAVNFQGSLSLNSTQFLDSATGNLSNIGTLGCGAITSSGAVEGTSLTDGTMTISAGGFSGVDSLTATGAVQGLSLTDGVATLTLGDLSGVGTIGCGAITSSGDFSCGLSIAQATGNMSSVGTIGCGAVTSSGAVEGTSLTDGTGSMSSGSLSSMVNGTFSGIVSSAQLQVNQSLTISSDGITYTQLTNGPDNGSCIIQISCHTEDDANGIWICSKTTGNAGVLSKLGGQVGNTSTHGLVGQWVDLEKPSFKFSTSWGGGTTDCSFKATILSF